MGKNKHILTKKQAEYFSECRFPKDLYTIEVTISEVKKKRVKTYHAILESLELFKSKDFYFLIGKINRHYTKTRLEKDSLELLTQGFCPYGRYKGSLVKDCPDDYLVNYLKFLKVSKDIVKDTFRELLLITALNKGLLHIQEEKRDQRAKEIAELHSVKLLSKWVGQIDAREMFEGVILSSLIRKGRWGDKYFITEIIQGDDIIVHMGLELGEVSEPIVLKAIVKGHQIYKGIPQTMIAKGEVIDLYDC